MTDFTVILLALLTALAVVGPVWTYRALRRGENPRGLPASPGVHLPGEPPGRRVTCEAPVLPEAGLSPASARLSVFGVAAHENTGTPLPVGRRAEPAYADKGFLRGLTDGHGETVGDRRGAGPVASDEADGQRGWARRPEDALAVRTKHRAPPLGSAAWRATGATRSFRLLPGGRP